MQQPRSRSPCRAIADRTALMMERDPGRVLLVEDEELPAGALAAGLLARGFDVEVAGDGADGLRLARTGRFDLIVLDLLLPGMAGYRFCQLLREKGDWTPVLVLSARRGEFEETRALDAGADDFLVKPFSFPVLVTRLRSLRRRRPPRPTGELVAGDLMLDPAQGRCWRGRTEVKLTPREFSLMHCLMRHGGAVVRKRDILDEVWDCAFEEESNIVEVYVGYLRRKVDTPFGKRAIRTVRGMGYRLDVTGC
jgi:DNA-binding response OmpR family regulator